MVLAQCPSAEPLCDFRPAACLSADNVELIERQTVRDRLDLSDSFNGSATPTAAHLDAWLPYAAYRAEAWRRTRTLLELTASEMVAEFDGYRERFAAHVRWSGKEYMAYLHFGSFEEIMRGYAQYHAAVLDGQVAPRSADLTKSSSQRNTATLAAFS